jgi:hypothetical protein
LPDPPLKISVIPLPVAAIEILHPELTDLLETTIDLIPENPILLVTFIYVLVIDVRSRVIDPPEGRTPVETTARFISKFPEPYVYGQELNTDSASDLESPVSVCIKLYDKFDSKLVVEEIPIN